MATFNPVQSFQTARQNALAMQRMEQDIDREAAQAPIRNEMAQLGLTEAKKQATRGDVAFDQQEAVRKATILNRTARALKGINPAQLPQAAAAVAPRLQQAGIDLGAIDLQNITPQDLDIAIAETQGFIQDPNKLTSAMREQQADFEILKGALDETGNFDPEKANAQQKSVAMKLGLIPKAGTQTKGERLAGDVDLTTSVAEAEATVEGTKKEAETGAKGKAERNQDIINRGLAAADSTASIRRGIELLNQIETGGIDRVNLAAKRLFGVESGDEGELSNLLGKAVLSQLRETFGAAFTAKEGEQLQSIEASFGKSPEANLRLLRNALRIAERSANRAIDRAVEDRDFKTAQDIKEALEFTLSTEEPVSDVVEGQTATNPQTGEKVVFRNGQWQPI